MNVCNVDQISYFLNVKRTRTPGLKMAAVKSQHKNFLQSTLRKKCKCKENNKHDICRPRSVRIGKNCALGLGYGRRPAASGRTQDLWHSFSQYGPPGRQITYIYFLIFFIPVVLSRNSFIPYLNNNKNTNYNNWVLLYDHECIESYKSVVLLLKLK